MAQAPPQAAGRAPIAAGTPWLSQTRRAFIFAGSHRRGRARAELFIRRFGLVIDVQGWGGVEWRVAHWPPEPTAAAAGVAPRPRRSQCKACGLHLVKLSYLDIILTAGGSNENCSGVAHQAAAAAQRWYWAATAAADARLDPACPTLGCCRVAGPICILLFAFLTLFTSQLL